jgi:glutamate--cysteine ligase
MQNAFKDSLKKLSELNLTNYLNFSQRGIEKESLRVNNSEISYSDHPKVLGSALTNPFITTDFSEALLEFITRKSSSIDKALDELKIILTYTHQNIDDVIWPGSVPCSIKEESKIRIANYGTSNSGKLKELYRIGLSYRYGSMMQCVSGIHYNFSLNEDFFKKWQGSKENFQSFQNKKYLNLIRNFRKNAWLLLYLFGASPVVPNTFLTDRKNFLKPLNNDDSFLENATCLRMSELGYMSEAQDDLNIAYNTLDEYISDLRNALTKKYEPYEKIGLKKDEQHIQINDSIIQIENEYYSSIRPKRVVDSGQRPINVLKNKGIEYVEVRCLDNNPFLRGSIDKHTAYFIEAYLMVSLIDEDYSFDEKRIKEIQDNWQNTVRNGRDPKLLLKRDGETISVKDAANEVFSKIYDFAYALPIEAYDLKDKILRSLEVQKSKLRDPGLTPSGNILKEMQEKNLTWDEFCNDRAEKNTNYYKSLKKDTTNIKISSEISIKDFEKLESSKEVDFDTFLKDYLNAI